MKSRDTLIRLKKFQVDEKRRRVNQIEGMIADFQRMSVDLEREIQTEQERAGINDPTHFAYPTYAKAAIQRRENLTRSADELRVQLEDAKSLLSEAFEELKKVEILEDRERSAERAAEAAREQAEMDAIARFATILGLDWGGLDVLRDAQEGRLYIVDANKTDMGPPTALPLAEKLHATRVMARAFRAFVNGAAQTDRGK